MKYRVDKRAQSGQWFIQEERQKAKETSPWNINVSRRLFRDRKRMMDEKLKLIRDETSWCRNLPWWNNGTQQRWNGAVFRQKFNTVTYNLGWLLSEKISSTSTINFSVRIHRDLYEESTGKSVQINLYAMFFILYTAWIEYDIIRNQYKMPKTHPVWKYSLWTCDEKYISIFWNLVVEP